MNEKIKKLLEKLKNPSIRLMVLIYALTLISCTGAIIISVSNVMDSTWAFVAYPVFAIAAVTLGYSVYTVVTFAPGMKQRVIASLESYTMTRTLMRNYSFRTIVFAAFALVMSIAYGIFNGVLGIISRSIWYGALAAYHIIIAVIRGRTIFSHVSTSDDFNSGELARARNYRNTGVQLLILNIALSSAIAQMIFDDRFFDYPDWTVFAYAAYAFYKITMSIVNIFKSRREDDLTVHAVRDINLIDAMVSLLALQTALLHAFGTAEVDVSLFNTLTGSVVSITSISLSVFMIVKANKNIKSELKKNGK